MSIVVAVAASDGIVIGTDGRQLGDDAAVLSDHMRRVFVIDGRFLIATYGVPLLHGRTIGAWMDQFAAGLDTRRLNLSKLVAAVGKFFDRCFGDERTVDSDELALGLL